MRRKSIMRAFKRAMDVAKPGTDEFDDSLRQFAAEEELEEIRSEAPQFEIYIPKDEPSDK